MRKVAVLAAGAANELSVFHLGLLDRCRQLAFGNAVRSVGGQLQGVTVLFQLLDNRYGVIQEMMSR